MKNMLAPLVAVFMIMAFVAVVNAEEPPATGSNAGYDGGFFIKNSDGSFQFNINGRVQPLLYLEKSTGSEAAWSFKIRRARLDFGAVIAEKGHADISVLHSTSSSRFKAINLYSVTTGYDFHNAFKVVVGTSGMPLSIGGPASSAAFHLIEPAIVFTQDDKGVITPLRSSFGNPDGLGIEFTGDIGKVFYDLAVVNGAAEPVKAKAAFDSTGAPIVDSTGTQINIEDATGGVETNYDINFNKRVSVGARIAYNILDPVPGKHMDLPYSNKPKLTVSVGANYQGTRQDPTNDVIVKRILTGSTGVAFRWRGFSATSEIFGRRTKLSDPGTTTWFAMSMDDFGYYADTGYFIVPNKFEVAGVVGQIFREGQNNNSYQFGGALNYYLKDNNFKAQLVYTLSGSYNDVTNAQITKTHFLGTMLTASF
ncbi:MAG: hypothetical protein HYT75_01290 [Deltaproteobacteria bacterium]|nr:hypothetical protein [Deltaproteobacteria bacterium]